MNQILTREQVADYAKIPGVNISTLIKMLQSPLHYKYAIEHESEPTPAMGLGIAIHCAVLEPTRFKAEYAVVKRAKPGEKRRETALTESQMGTVQAAASAVRSDPTARRLMDASQSELTLTWQDPKTLIECKGRADCITLGHHLIDLKTARDASPWGFCSAAARLEYHTKMAWYADAYELITGHKPTVFVIAIESSAPFSVVCYEMCDDPELDIGRKTYRELLEKLVECRKTNVWPGIGDGTIQRFMLPKWKLPESGDSIDELGLEF